MHLLIALILIVINVTVCAQISIQNISLTNPSLNILYVGVDNIIDVKGLDTNNTYTIVSATGKVANWANNYVVRHTLATTDTLRLYQSNKLVVEKTFDIHKIGNAITRLGNVTDTSTTVQRILSNTKIYILLPNCFYKHFFSIRSFDIILVQKKGAQLFEEEIQGDQLTVKAINSISKLKSGDKIILTKIVAVCPDCNLRRLADLIITIE
jgi:hypothetical protein